MFYPARAGSAGDQLHHFVAGGVRERGQEVADYSRGDTVICKICGLLPAQEEHRGWCYLCTVQSMRDVYVYEVGEEYPGIGDS